MTTAELPTAAASLRLRSIDGTDLHVVVAGPEDATPVVLLHGWAMSSRFWHHQIRALASDHRVIAPDLRGHGASGAPGHLGTTIEGLCADLDTLVDELELLDRRPAMVGHSLGGMALVAWAGRGPGRAGNVRALGLVSTACQETCSSPMTHRPRLSRLAAAVSRATLAAPARLPARRTPLGHRITRTIAHGPHAEDADIALTHRLFLDCDRHVRAGFGRTLGRIDLAEPAARVPVPATVVLGTADRMVAPTYSRRLAETLPRAELVELDRIGHQAPLEAPQRITAIIRQLAGS